MPQMMLVPAPMLIQILIVYVKLAIVTVNEEEEVVVEKNRVFLNVFLVLAMTTTWSANLTVENVMEVGVEVEVEVEMEMMVIDSLQQILFWDQVV